MISKHPLRHNLPHVLRLFVTAAVIVAGAGLRAGYGQTKGPDLLNMSLEDLMNLKVTSVSRKAQSLKDTPAAVFVITKEDIRRSGYTTLPEVLRMVPGLQVARISGSRWAITARGFNAMYANKLLVLLDGRPIYSPTFAGVLWEYVDIVLEQVDRIEVIRGPGATMWGANAVNGVISIFTTPAGAREGGSVSVLAGNFERASETVEWEGRAGRNLGYRLYARNSLRNLGFTSPLNGGAANGPWHRQHAGGRLDWQASEKDSWSIEAEGYRSAMDESLGLSFPFPPFGAIQPVTTRYIAGDVTVRWNRKQSETSEMSLQFFYDHHDLDQSNATASGIGENLKQADLDFQYRTRVLPRHELIWGGEFRYSANNQRNSFSDSFIPAHRADPLYAGFVQDDIALVPGRLLLSVGTKAEHNNYTGVEVQPSARLFWTLNSHQGLWGSVARAVSTPSRVYTDLAVNSFAGMAGPGLPMFVQFKGYPNEPSEQMVAYETGYRRHGKTYAVEVAAFLNRYKDVRNVQAMPASTEFSGSQPLLIVPFQFLPTIHGSTYGLEISASWNVTERWHLSGSESLLRMNLTDRPIGIPRYLPPLDGSSPSNQVQLHSAWDVTPRLQCDLSIYHVGRITSLQVPAFTTADARIGWKLSSRIDLSLAVQNLLNNRHLEFVPEDPSVPPLHIGRAGNLKLTWYF